MLFNDLETLRAKVNKGLNNGWLDQVDWLVPDEAASGRVYGLIKNHMVKEKWPPGSNIPPSRPFESTTGTTFENAPHFVDFHSNDLVKKLPSYWQDTPDMLRCFDAENNIGPQPEGTIPVTLDVSSLYTNITIDQGIEAFRFFLDRQDNTTVPTKFLITLLILILTCNILVFDGDHYLAMGTCVAPTLACLLMGAFENIALKKWKGVQPHMYKRYINDILFL